MKINFLEKWILDLVKSEYELGNIPQTATYKFKERKDDFIEVTVHWLAEEKAEHKIVYCARAYGKPQLGENIEIEDNSIFDLERYYTLEIHNYIDNIKRSYSTRKIAEYDVMNVVDQLGGKNQDFDR